MFLIYSAVFHIGMLGILDVVLNFYFVSLGHSPETIGVLQSLPRLAGFLTSVPIGLLANRIGTRRMLILSTVGCTLALYLQLIPFLPMLVLSRFLFGLFYGAQQIANAPLMIDLMDARGRTRFFALHNVVSMGAMAGGSLIGGFIPSLVVGLSGGLVPPAWIVSATTTYAYGATIFLGGLVGLIGAAPLVLMRTHGQGASASTHEPLRSSRVPWRILILITLPMLAFGFSGGLTFPFYNLFWRTQFDLPDQSVGTILSIGWIGMGLVPLIDGILERRFGRAGALGFTMTVGALAFFGLGLLPPLIVSLGLFVIAISFRNTMNPLYQPLLLESLPRDLHNVVSSMSMVMWNIGWFAATASGGFIQTRLGFGVMMQIVAVGVMITGVTVVVIFRRRREALAHFTQEWQRRAEVS
ncbi:MAG: MFS transporter [Chloroflexi bacterium]|nr:MFS transporter [Chloroflexota bacterium]